MIGPEFQKVVRLALVAGDVCGGRVHDRVPSTAVFPYGQLGEEQVIDDGNSCGDAWEVYLDLHLWSRPDDGSKRELKDQAKAAGAAIKGIGASAIAGLRITDIVAESFRAIDDPDGITKHGILTIRALVDEA
ncbi:hypothetical protein M2360_000926 [Rhizobium sp. SG_E_25_P2]|uniref:DUF3168 domain-containing protein n=1 Tax=Rhizobium sp. SG_E_25_P2 TaxID=2879942 RepID=UPI002475B88F|nr:DUF3168 domain-containing protein [Rhizobium sp. SG_E_25_P2]MDH6265536.1 hypothetical protein [Rhizobium sp. SG_E_25_P2]